MNGSDLRVTWDTPGYLPSAGQYAPAIAHNTSDGRFLVVWHDQGRKASATSEWGIWGNIWSPTRQVYLPLVLRSY